jgi:hypothetical protein
MSVHAREDERGQPAAISGMYGQRYGFATPCPTGHGPADWVVWSVTPLMAGGSGLAMVPAQMRVHAERCPPLISPCETGKEAA